MPLINLLLRPLKAAKTFSKKIIKYIQNVIKGFLSPPKSRKQYVLLGRRFYSKKLLMILLLLLLLLSYFIFISPPAFVNKWMNRTISLHEKADKPLTYSGTANVYRSEEHTSELQSRPHLVC